MIPSRIKTAIENSNLNDAIDKGRYGLEWSDFTRTVFEQIARKINAKVTTIACLKKYLIDDLLLLGREELENLLFKLDLGNTSEFIEHLKGLNGHNSHCWISGKTLYTYWNGGNAKDKKLNVLLTYLDVETQHWDDWKANQVLEEDTGKTDSSNNTLLKTHYLGSYFRYFQKTDGSPTLVKAPLQISTDHRGVIVFTKTTGHEYRSSSVRIRGGALYIDCENIVWNEKESHIYNVGFESNPQLLLGVSITLDRRGQALGIKNVLVKQGE
ncbi:MAG: hypothetical protein AAF901_00555, partial [Bacteroidota bacterium]